MRKLSPEILPEPEDWLSRVKKTGASFARGLSFQEYTTPSEFIDAVKARFNVKLFAFDLAASKENSKAGSHFYSESDDSLVKDWTKLKGELWLNPPFGTIAPWAQKCSESRKGLDRRIFLLVPAAVGSNWYSNYVHKKALVVFLNGRISFDGKNGYPKDCMLCVYGVPPGIIVWRWKDQDAQAK